MKLHTTNHRKTGAFTLIEMIGVLAVIAILAGMLIPKVFSAISNARVSNAAVCCETIKTALADHYAKYGAIPVDGTTNPPITLTPSTGAALQFDLVLLKEGFLDKPFAVKIGDGISGSINTRVEVISIAGLKTGDTVDANGASGYALAGGTTNSITGSVLAQAVITGVTESDARDLSDRIDGSSAAFTNPTTGTSDASGRVKYATSATTTTVYVYLTHR